MSRIAAFIFDLDGTLADSIADIGEATNAVLAQHGLPGHSLEAYKRFVGEGAENLIRRAFVSALGGDWKAASVSVTFPAPLAELVEAYRVAYDTLDHKYSTAYPGIDRMLDGLVAAGRPMAVLSNKRDDFTRGLVARQFGRWPFVDVRGEREGVPRKPDPAAALELAVVLKTPPSRVAFVGDTPIDMRTATSAGMYPVGVLWGFRSKEELLSAGAQRLIERPEALLELL